MAGIAALIRPAREGDAAAMADIYRPHVESGFATFELDPPDAAEMARRIAACGDAYPWLVAERADGAVVGYAYAGAFRTRPAYRWAVETSIYLAPEAHRRGVGRRLYGALIETLIVQGYAQAVGTITLPNDASTAFHEAMGFRLTGHWPDIGHKRGRWLTVAVYQRGLAVQGEMPVEPIGLSSLRA